MSRFSLFCSQVSQENPPFSIFPPLVAIFIWGYILFSICINGHAVMSLLFNFSESIRQFYCHRFGILSTTLNKSYKIFITFIRRLNSIIDNIPVFLYLTCFRKISQITAVV